MTATDSSTPDLSRGLALANVDCSPKSVGTMEELIAALKRKAERTPPGRWVFGTRYQETKLGRHPTRHDLDRASTNHPIIISHSSGHQSVCNSFALERARITRDTEDPPGEAGARGRAPATCLPSMAKRKRRHITPDEQSVLQRAQGRLLTSPADLARCDQLILEHHYLHEATLAGEHLRYTIVYRGRWLGVALGAARPSTSKIATPSSAGPSSSAAAAARCWPTTPAC